MDERFNAVFRGLYDDFTLFWDEPERYLRRRRRFLPFDPRVALVVRDAIERAVGRLDYGQRIRWDGRYFLLINFTQMIAEPLVLDPEKRADFEGLAADIEADTEAILREAESTSRGTNRAAITGGEVLRAVASNYDALKINRFRVWN